MALLKWWAWYSGKSLYSGIWETQIVPIELTHNCTVYTCVVQTGDPNWFCAAVSPSIFCAGFPFYKVTDKGRAATHQLYSFDIEVGLRQ